MNIKELTTDVVNVKNYLIGKKSYIVAAGVLAAGVANMMGYHIPDYGWALLAGTGLAAHRASIAQLATDLAALQDAYNILSTTVKENK